MTNDPMPQPPVNANPRAAVAPGKAGPSDSELSRTPPHTGDRPQSGPAPTGTVTMPQRPQRAAPLVGRPATIASAGPPAKGDGKPVYEWRHDSGEWLPAETAVEDDRGIPYPPAPAGYRNLVIHLDPVKHYSASTRALRIHAPYDDRDDAPAGSFRKRYPGASKAEAERRADEYMDGQKPEDLYDDDPAAYGDETAAEGAEDGTPQRRGWRKAEGERA